MININKNNGIHNSKSHTCCPICGGDVLVGELFCEKCGMRIHNHQHQERVKEVNRHNSPQSALTNINHSSVARYGMHTLSERPDLKRVIDGCKSSHNTPYSKNVIEDLRNRVLDDISDIIADDVTAMAIFESLGIRFIETRDFGLDRCTEAVKEIFNLGVLMSWAHLSIKQRAELAGVYAKEVARAFELVWYEGLWLEELKPNVSGYNTGDGKIHMSISLILNPDVSPFEIIDTITHESRHQYQFEAIRGYHNIPKEVIKEWTVAFEIYRNDAAPCCYDPWGYHYSPIEIDARYAAETVIRNITQFLFNIKHTNKKSLIDSQQLRYRLIQEGYTGVLLDQTTHNMLKLKGPAAEMLNSWLDYGIVPRFDDIYGLSSTFLREHLKMKDPAIILSYGLLIDNPSRNSRYLKSLLNHQPNKYAAKANLRSRYIFYLERDYDNAKDAIYYGNRIVYNKLEWYGDWTNINGHDHVWRVDLYDNLTQEELEWTVGHIREHNGLYYKD